MYLAAAADIRYSDGACIRACVRNGVNQRWIQGPGILCYGVRIGFRANEEDLLKGIESVFSPGWRSCGDNDFDFLYSLEVDGRRTEYAANLGGKE